MLKTWKGFNSAIASFAYLISLGQCHGQLVNHYMTQMHSSGLSFLPLIPPSLTPKDKARKE